MDKTESALSFFIKGFSCSQAVISAYADQFNLDGDLALRLSSAFGGGMAHMAETCGSVTGAFMVIGLKYGGTRPEDTEAKEKTNGLAKEFVKRFRLKRGTIVCRDLLNLDISTEQGMAEAMNKKLFETVCPALVKDAVEILEEII